MNRVYETSLVCVLVSAIVIGCRAQHVENANPEGLPVMDKHHWQSIDQNGWKVQKWVAAAGLVNDPIHVWIRVTPPAAAEKKLPKIKTQMLLAHKGDPKFSRRFEESPRFEECSKLPRRIEIAVWKGESERHDFPPKEFAWEAVVKDAFKSDYTLNGTPGATKLAPGAYDLHITVDLGMDNVKPFVFASVEKIFVTDFKKPR